MSWHMSPANLCTESNRVCNFNRTASLCTHVHMYTNGYSTVNCIIKKVEPYQKIFLEQIVRVSSIFY